MKYVEHNKDFTDKAIKKYEKLIQYLFEDDEIQKYYDKNLHNMVMKLETLVKKLNHWHITEKIDQETHNEGKKSDNDFVQDNINDASATQCNGWFSLWCSIF